MNLTGTAPALLQAAPAPATEPARLASLRKTAEELEATFLGEMLAHAGLEATEGPFSGGTGETQFASFLRQEQARLIASRGGIGLAEHIFTALAEAGRDTSA